MTKDKKLGKTVKKVYQRETKMAVKTREKKVALNLEKKSANNWWQVMTWKSENVDDESHGVHTIRAILII